MSFRVVWSQRIRNSLHVFSFRLMHDRGDTDELELALAEINSRLVRDPANEGESRSEAERVLIVHPLSVTFEVFEEAGVVLIHDLVFYPRTRM